MKNYEVWEGDHHVFVSEWDNYEDAREERDRLNSEHNRDYFLKKNTPRGKLVEVRR